MAAGLEHVEEADEVALEVGARVLDGVAHARLCGEVHHDVEAVLREQALDEGGIAQISSNESEAAVPVRLCEHRQAGLLDARVVVAVHVVQADNHVVGLLEKPLYQERADEAGCTGNQNLSLHVTLLRMRGTDEYQLLIEMINGVLTAQIPHVAELLVVFGRSNLEIAPA